MTDEKLLEAARVLATASVITTNPYKNSKTFGEPQIYRMRLFSERERAVLRAGLRKNGSAWECIEGGAGLMDELEMVQFEAHGRSIKDVKRTIGR